MINKAILVGNVGKDPEVRYLENNNIVASFSLATNEIYKDKNGAKKQNTEWHNIVVWGKLAEIAEKYIKKGQNLYIEGKITTRSWDSDNGKKYITEIVVQNMTMLPSPKKEVEQSSGFDNSPSHSDDIPDDLPF